jgi:hypothetical protein
LSVPPRRLFSCAKLNSRRESPSVTPPPDGQSEAQTLGGNS